MVTKLYFLLFAFLFYTAPLSGQMLKHLQKQVNKIIYYDTDIDLEKIPGFVIAIQLGDSTYIWGNGVMSQANEKAPDENTVFEIGGLTKVFTSSLVNLMVEAEQIHYDSSLNFYLPDHYKNPLADKLTIRDLVQHTSGFPRMPHEFGLKEKESQNPYAHYTQKDLLNFYKDFYIDEEINTEFLYSHVNYALLEYVVEQVSGKSFENLLQEKILQPLQMDNSWISEHPKQTQELAQGHSLSGKTCPMWTFQSFKASEGLKSNALDLLKFLQSNIGQGDQADLTASFAQNHIGTVDTRMQYKTYTGNGWHVLKMKKYHDVILHAGATDGQRAFMGFVKEAQNGVVILSNSERGMKGLGVLILRMINHNWKKKKKKGKS